MALNDRQLAFCEGILRGESQSEAYRNAGFKATTRGSISVNASQLMKVAKVREYLEMRRQQLREKTDVTSQRVIQEIARVGFSDIRDFAKWDENGVIFIPSTSLTAEQAAAVQSIKSKTKTYTDEDGNETKTVEQEIKLHPKMDGLEKLSKHLGLYQQDRVNDADRQTHLLATLLWKFVMSMHVAKQIPVPEALKYAEQNPDEVEQWGREQKLLTPESETTN